MTSQDKNGRRMGGTLRFSSTGAYGENYWITREIWQSKPWYSEINKLKYF